MAFTLRAHLYAFISAVLQKWSFVCRGGLAMTELVHLWRKGKLAQRLGGAKKEKDYC